MSDLTAPDSTGPPSHRGNTSLLSAPSPPANSPPNSMELSVLGSNIGLGRVKETPPKD